jgi:hypothetical protein
MPDAFKHMDGQQVPLVWAHGHKNITDVLGHAILEARSDGMYAYGFFNTTPGGQTAKALVQHKDVNSLSIWANQLVERMKQGAKQVFHGMIKEVSLVMSGANPGALIDSVSIRHDDGTVYDLEDEVIIYTGESFMHIAEDEDEEDLGEVDLEHAEGMTIKEIYETFTDVQKKVVHFMIGTALEAASDDSAEHSDEPDEDSEDSKEGEDLTHKEGTEVNMNVFETNAGGGTTQVRERKKLSHEAVKGIMASFQRGGSLKHAVEEYAKEHLEHGIEDIDLLFPDAKAVSNTPEFDKRRTEWVSGVLNGTKHTPFSRIKSLVATITHAEARAKGYIKGNFKKEEWFGLAKRTTSPSTIYKKQKLDRDDIIDIVELDVVAWMKAEMRLMLEEELARAILIGDGRAVDDEDKVKDPIGAQDGVGIRSILHDHELYAATTYVNILDANSDYNEAVEKLLLDRHLLKGSGSPTFYTTNYHLVRMLLSKDTLGRRRWNNKSELAAAMMVNDIVEVEVMEDETDLLGIIVNLADYNIGTDRGGEINFFDDFDIDYNQLKYLYETRLSGALVKIRSALIIKMTAEGDVLVEPNAPTFVSSTGVITIVATTGIVYKDVATDDTLSTGAQTALAEGASMTVRAVPSSGYYVSNNIEDEWTFTRPAA